MKRFNFKKSEMVIYVIAIMLVAAGYFNYINFNQEEKSVSSDIVAEERQNTGNVGDAVLVSNNELNEENENYLLENCVSNNEVNGSIDNLKKDEKQNENENENYYMNSKLDRDKMYAEMITNYEGILNNPNVSEVQKNIATEEIKKINNAKNAIMISENLILTKGFNSCIIFINGDSVNIIVHKESKLNSEDVSKIQNIITREIGTKIENIHIAEK